MSGQVRLTDESIKISRAPMLGSSHPIDTVYTGVTCIYHFNTSMQPSLLHAARKLDFDRFSADIFYRSIIDHKLVLFDTALLLDLRDECCTHTLSAGEQTAHLTCHE